ncbi:hypothetical protein [Halococcus sediminicola]|uniref:hypothetical protein n=1 Tax=Halococcus sediminicola TaxID=1264579 RepID=UPI000A866266|nr:hypothetical protein [Halococcus sediminicola]
MDTFLHLGFSHAEPVVVVVAAIATFAIGLWIGMRRRADDRASTRFDEESDQ